jgi:DNA-binding response OmpR family regulator
VRSRAAPVDPRGLRALVVDDAEEITALVAELLRGEGFAVTAVRDGHEAIEVAKAQNPDLIVLDLGLPGVDGVTVCERVRGFSTAYVIMLTARGDEVDRLIGLSSGADDYVTKPFSARELVARVRALLRRPRAAHGAQQPTVSARRRIGSLEIDPDANQVWRDGEELRLTPVEFRLLDVLSSAPHRTFSRASLLKQVWQGEWFGSDHVVDVHMSNLRRKIEPDPRRPVFIKTVRGIGYRMDEPS